jgi:hypothetical protein
VVVAGGAAAALQLLQLLLVLQPTMLTLALHDCLRLL